MSKRGIDISEWQPSSKINYKKLASEVSFVILRSSYGNNTIDKEFLNHVKKCNENNIKILGVYHFLYTISVEDARKEAINCINAVKKAGLPKSTIIFADFEYDTVNKAKEQGITLTKKDCIAHTKAFCEYCEKEGYPVGIYANQDYRKNMYSDDLINKYIFWLADPSGTAKYDYELRQYSGKLDAYKGDLDMDLMVANTFSTKNISDYLITKKAVLRKDAGIKKEEIIKLNPGTKVKCTGFSSKSEAGNKWIYVSTDIDKVHYEGFVVEKKCKKVKK